MRCQAPDAEAALTFQGPFLRLCRPLMSLWKRGCQRSDDVVGKRESALRFLRKNERRSVRAQDIFSSAQPSPSLPLTLNTSILQLSRTRLPRRTSRYRDCNMMRTAARASVASASSIGRAQSAAAAQKANSSSSSRPGSIHGEAVADTGEGGETDPVS